MTAATLMRAVADRACADPDALALLAPGRPPLTYARLASEVARGMQTLAACGLGHGSRIGLALRNGPEAAVALLVAAETATCAPLNPDTDAEASRLLLDALRIDALIVSAGEPVPARAAAAGRVAIIELAFSPADPAGVFALAASRSPAPVAARAARPEDIALLLHTSGTTARPKVVATTHGSIAAAVERRARLLRMTAGDRCLLLAPLFLASGIRRNLFLALGVGGSVVCPPGFDAGAFVDWLETLLPTFYTGSPTIQRAALDALERQSRRPRHALRFVCATSAASPPDLLDRLERALGVPVLAGYSTTETGGIAQAPLPPGERRPGSVGLATDCEVAILGDAGAFLPAGAVGEVLVRGEEKFDGYENDPEATRQAFHEGWYRTGDLGYRDRDGYIFLCGRVKELINRGGFKVAPSEVDAALENHPEVAAAATFAVPHTTLGEDVAAAVVLRRAGSVSAQDLRDHALSVLSAYKVPTRIEFVDALPRTASGKVPRRDLAARFGESPRRAFEAPAGPHEALVARAFADVLGIEAIGALDNFFELGGDSLRGARAIARVNAAAGCDLPATALFRRPTVRGFAAEVAAVASAQEPAGPPAIRPRVRSTAPDAASRAKP